MDNMTSVATFVNTTIIDACEIDKGHDADTDTFGPKKEDTNSESNNGHSIALVLCRSEYEDKVLVVEDEVLDSKRVRVLDLGKRSCCECHTGLRLCSPHAGEDAKELDTYVSHWNGMSRT